MRAQIAERSQGELIDLCIQLQNTIDANVHRIRGLEASQEQMGKQIPALQARNAELESYYENLADSEELAELKEKNRVQAERIEKLLELNEKLQEKLVS